MTTETQSVPMYGNFHRPRGFGILKMGPLGSVLAGIAGLIAVVLVPSAGIVVAVAFVIVVGAALAGVSIPWRHNMTVLDHLVIRLGFMRAEKAGSTLYIPGSLTDMGGHRLPGVLADSKLAVWEDHNGDPFTLLRYPANRAFVIPFRSEPDGSSLVDPSDMTEQISNFGAFLGGLAYESGLKQAAFTIESSQDPGSALVREMDGHVSSKASKLSKEWAAEVKTTYPTGGSTIRAYGSLSYVAPKMGTDMHGNKVKGQDPADIVGALVKNRLPDLLSDLNETGAGLANAMTAEETIEAVRCAYNPGDRAIYDEMASRGEQPPVQLWNSVGPSGAVEHWNYYEHGDGASITWEVTGFVSAQMAAKALAPLLEPTEGVAIKRITFLYRPVDPAKAGGIAESNFNAAEGRARNQKKPSAESARESAEADQIRKASAAGHALEDFAILITVTVTDKDKLSYARQTIKQLGPTARLLLHAMNGTQAAAFAQCVGPLGLMTDHHLNIPTAISKGL